MLALDSSSRTPRSIVNIYECIIDYVKDGDWDNLSKFVHEVLVGMWINNFMRETRKVWTRQCGMGSQSQELLGYRVLSNAILSVIDEEEELYGDDDDEELDENETANETVDKIA